MFNFKAQFYDLVTYVPLELHATPENIRVQISLHREK